MLQKAERKQKLWGEGWEWGLASFQSVPLRPSPPAFVVFAMFPRLESLRARLPALQGRRHAPGSGARISAGPVYFFPPSKPAKNGILTSRRRRWRWRRSRRPGSPWWCAWEGRGRRWGGSINRGKESALVALRQLHAGGLIQLSLFFLALRPQSDSSGAEENWKWRRGWVGPVTKPLAKRETQ